MPRKAAVASEWKGAPPASEGSFSFANSEFFAESTGQNRHRRATITELKEQISSGSDKDRPAHWFEAQLLHYGLKPSKTKSVARMRLFDAVNAGELAVPNDISQLEKKLKATWNKSDREAKKKVATPTPKQSATNTVAGSKRKAAAEKSTPSKKASAEKPATKKAKTNPPIPNEAAPDRPRTKQTARRGGIAASGPSRRTVDTRPQETSPSMPRQTARRGSWARDRNPSSRQSQQSYNFEEALPMNDEDDLPPPYSMEQADDFGPLGLLNGNYQLRSPYVTDQWPSLGTEFGLTLTISGRQLWGRFDLGVIEGVMHFPERPWNSSDEGVPFTWRGRENEGPIFYGGQNAGEIRFLGGGVIEGEFDYQGIGFHGRRLSSQGTRSSVSAPLMEQEWDDYSEERYEEENLARWR